MKSAKVRLYVDHTLGKGQSVALSREQAHYLFGVMRLVPGNTVSLFNGRNGEWQADVVNAGRKDGTLVCTSQSVMQQNPPDLWLLFAPVKKARTDFIVEKAVELGVSRICPVLTDFTNSERIRRDRLQSHAVEASEQCGATYVPEVAELRKLSSVLDDWPTDRNLMFCDEGLTGETFNLPVGSAPWAVLVGPEGGFSASERTRITDSKFAHPVALGPRILRADTAVVASLTLWQNLLGDWR